jgi:hypothetical protein
MQGLASSPRTLSRSVRHKDLVHLEYRPKDLQTLNSAFFSLLFATTENQFVTVTIIESLESTAKVCIRKVLHAAESNVTKDQS